MTILSRYEFFLPQFGSVQVSTKSQSSAVPTNLLQKALIGS